MNKGKSSPILSNSLKLAHFAIMCDGIGEGLEKQILLFTQRHLDIKLSIIATLQKVRRSQNDNAYASDY